MVAKILVVEPDDSIREGLELAAANLGPSQLELKSVSDAAHALAYLDQVAVDLVFCHPEVEGLDGFDIVHQLAERLDEGAIVLTADLERAELAKIASQRGAYDALAHPIQAPELSMVLQRVADRIRRTRAQVDCTGELRSEGDDGAIVAASEPMIQVLEQLESAAEFDSPALLLGEFGTRKRLMAQAIHSQSARRGSDFFVLNCGAFDEMELKDRLWGSRPQNARKRQLRHRGLINLAQGGTLLLEQVDKLPARLQSELLRLLQAKEYWDATDRKSRPTDTRILASTSGDLAAAVSKGSFDAALYEQLASIVIELPPLRERQRDIRLLVDQFLARSRSRLGRRIGAVTDEALTRLCEYPWPGNVRELQATIERAAALADGEGVTLAHLPHEISQAYQIALAESGENFALKPARQAFEAQFIVRALEAANGNRTHAARLLGISHRNLLYKLKAYAISD